MTSSRVLLREVWGQQFGTFRYLGYLRVMGSEQAVRSDLSHLAELVITRLWKGSDSKG